MRVSVRLHIIKELISFLLLLFIVSACNEQKQAGNSEQNENTLFDPPVLHLLDSMPPPKITVLKNTSPPRVIPIPEKAGGFYNMHSEMGAEKIQLSPPVITAAGEPVLDFTNYTAEDGLVITSIGSSFMDNKGQLWFGTRGGGVYSYDGNNFTNYSVKQGLANINVYTITEDKNGHLWFGTNLGVSRFDGIRFTTYTIKDGLPDDIVLSIICDRNGDLWFGTYNGGLSRYDGTKFTTYDTSHGLPNNNINRVLEDSKGNIWLASYGGGLCKYDGHQFKTYTSLDGLPTNLIVTLHEDIKGIIWIGTSKGIWNFDGISFQPVPGGNDLENYFINGIKSDSEGDLWITTNGNGIYRFDGRDMKVITTKQGLVNNSVNCLITDRRGNIWIGTEGGLSCIKEKSIGIYSGEQGLSDNAPTSILEDKSGNLWFGTYGNGAIKFDGKRFTAFTANQGLGSNTVLDICEDKSGNIWLATEHGGLHCYNGTQLTTYMVEQGLVENSIISIYCDRAGNLWFGSSSSGVSMFDGNVFTNYTSEQGLPKNSVNDILEDAKGNIWISTEGGGVCTLNKNSVSVFTTQQGIADNTVFGISQDKAGNIWLVTDNGISRFDGTGFYTLPTKEILSDQTVTVISEDEEGVLWFGTDEGISSLKIDTGKTVKNDRTYIGAGLLKKNNEEFKQYKAIWEIYSRKTGYPFSDVMPRSLCFTKKTPPYGEQLNPGTIWSGFGDSKVIRFDPKNLRKNSFQPTVRLKGISIDESRLNWYGFDIPAHDSIVRLQQESMVYGDILPDYVRDSLQNKFSDIRFDSISLFETIPHNLVLPYRHNHVSFDFGAIETSRPFMVRYQYILNGYDAEWSPVTEKSSVSYGNISEGTYTFMLKARSPEGVWSEPISYSFRVLPPWYRSWWAYVIYALGFISLITTYVSWHTKRLKKQKLQLEDKVNLRTAQLEQSICNLKATQAQLVQSEKMASLGELTAGIAHEIQNPLNFVNNFSEMSNELIAEMKEELDKGDIEEAKLIASNISQNLEKINHHGKRADSIVKGMLQHSRTNTGVKESTNINTLADEYLRLAFQGMRAKDKNFNTTLESDFDETIGKVNIIPQDIGRVLLNLYNNSFYAVAEKQKQSIEGYEPTVSVRTKKVNGELEISISDNGNGIPEKVLDKVFQPFFTTKPTGQGTGLGLSLSYDIIKAHQGKISIKNKPGMGAEFIIILPITT